MSNVLVLLHCYIYGNSLSFILATLVNIKTAEDRYIYIHIYIIIVRAGRACREGQSLTAQEVSSRSLAGERKPSHGIHLAEGYVLCACQKGGINSY